MRGWAGDEGPFASGHTTLCIRFILRRDGTSYLDTGILRTKVQCLVVGRVRNAKDVAHIVGRPQRVQASEA